MSNESAFVSLEQSCGELATAIGQFGAYQSEFRQSIRVDINKRGLDRGRQLSRFDHQGSIRGAQFVKSCEFSRKRGQGRGVLA